MMNFTLTHSYNRASRTSDDTDGPITTFQNSVRALENVDPRFKGPTKGLKEHVFRLNSEPKKVRMANF
jgi:hypothetical protein